MFSTPYYFLWMAGGTLSGAVFLFNAQATATDRFGATLIPIVITLALTGFFKSLP